MDIGNRRLGWRFGRRTLRYGKDCHWEALLSEDTPFIYPPAGNSTPLVVYDASSPILSRSSDLDLWALLFIPLLLPSQWLNCVWFCMYLNYGTYLIIEASVLRLFQPCLEEATCVLMHSKTL